jgi:hypothetical protein
MLCEMAGLGSWRDGGAAAGWEFVGVLGGRWLGKMRMRRVMVLCLALRSEGEKRGEKKDALELL